MADESQDKKVTLEATLLEIALTAVIAEPSVSTLAMTDALAKLIIEQGVITGESSKLN